MSDDPGSGVQGRTVWTPHDVRRADESWHGRGNDGRRGATAGPYVDLVEQAMRKTKECSFYVSDVPVRKPWFS
jgi:hypothetical protein